jgi:hypothetical protein
MGSKILSLPSNGLARCGIEDQGAVEIYRHVTKVKHIQDRSGDVVKGAGVGELSKPPVIFGAARDGGLAGEGVCEICVICGSGFQLEFCGRQTV